MTYVVPEPIEGKPHIRHYLDLVQHTDEWQAARCGLLTASNLKLLLTASNLSPANNEKTRAHLYDLVSQRASKFVEPSFSNFDMERGVLDEMDALALYNQKIAPLQSCGFITNSSFGFTLGYSPDALLEIEDGQVEVKSRKQKYQMETILSDDMPADYLIQVQAGLLISERSFCDFVSYSGGMPMYVKRIYPDDAVQAAILAACTAAEEKMTAMLEDYQARVQNPLLKLIPTQRRKEEITI